jgi:hypothetical protein
MGEPFVHTRNGQDLTVMVRGRLREVVVAVAVLLGAAACSSSSSGPPSGSFSDPCAAKPQGGAVCITVLANKGVVGDVIGYLSSTKSPLKGKEWRLVLSSYHCYPGTGATPSCAPMKSYPTAARHGVPPIEMFCRLANGKKDTTSPGCHNTLDAEYATHGDWTGFPITSKGYTVHHAIWLCVSEQIASGKSWTSPSLTPTPTRACSAATPE